MVLNTYSGRMIGAVQFWRMNRDAGPFEIADLVARAERIKRNREIILRTVLPKALPTSSLRPSVAISADQRLENYVRALNVDPQP